MNVGRNLSTQEQLFLKAVVSEFKHSGIEEAEFGKLYTHHLSLCRFEGEKTPLIMRVREKGLEVLAAKQLQTFSDLIFILPTDI